MKLALIIPAHNEEKRIGKTLEAYSEFLEKIREKEEFDYEMIIVINNTHDDTEGVIKPFVKKNKRISYVNLEKGGKGYALTEGFKLSIKKNVDYIGFVDADMATIPEELWKLMDVRGYDGAVASRYEKRSKIFPKQSFRTAIVGRIFNLIVRIIFMINYRDTQCGAKIFKKKVIEKILPELKMSSWAYDVNLLYSCNINEFRIASIPTVWYEIEGGSLKVGKSSIQMLLSIVQLRIIRSPFRRLLSPLKPISKFLWRITQ